MSRERLTRLQRVLDARKEAADRLEMELGTLTRAVLAAEQGVERSRRAWVAAMNVTLSGECSSADLSEAHGYAMTLGQRHDAAVREAREASRRRDGCQVRLRAAWIEVRKLELWRGRVLEAMAGEEAGRERRTMDELAARLARTG